MGTPTLGQSTAFSDTILSRQILKPDEVIHMTGDQDNTAMYRLFSMIPMETAGNSKYTWYEDEDYRATVRITTAASDSATTLVVVSGDEDILRKYDALYNLRTGEVIHVTATPTTSSIAVTRGFGSEAAAAILAGDEFAVMGNVLPELSSPVDVYNREPWTQYNYVQMMREGWKISGLAKAEQVYGPDKLTYDRQNATREFLRKIERSFLFGQRYKTGSSTATYRQTGGLQYFMTADGSRTMNVDVTGTIFTESVFNNLLVRYFNQADTSDSKVAFCGTNHFLAMSSWARDKQQIIVNNAAATEKLGTAVYDFQCSTGQILHCVPYKPWNYSGNGGLGLDDQIWILDTNKMAKFGVNGRPVDVTLTTSGTSDGNLAGIGVDGEHNELQLEVGFKLWNTENFAIISGIGA